QREPVDIGPIEARHVDRRDHRLAEHAAARLRQRHRLAAQRAQRQVAMEACGRDLGIDDLEKLLLPRQPAERQLDLVHRCYPGPDAPPSGGGADSSYRKTVTVAPCGWPSLPSGTSTTPSACAAAASPASANPITGSTPPSGRQRTGRMSSTPIAETSLRAAAIGRARHGGAGSRPPRRRSTRPANSS